MLIWLLFDLVHGFQHALEADYISVVTALSVEMRGFGDIIRHGAVWGIGHTLMLSVGSGYI